MNNCQELIDALSVSISKLVHKSEFVNVLESIMVSRSAQWPAIFTSPETSFPDVLGRISITSWDLVVDHFLLTVGKGTYDLLCQDIIDSVQWYRSSGDDLNPLSRDVIPANSEDILCDSPRIGLFYLLRFLELPDG